MLDRLIWIGLIGIVGASVCATTPLLSVLLAKLGWSRLAVWADAMVGPALLFFIALTLVALWRKRTR